MMKKHLRFTMLAHMEFRLQAVYALARFGICIWMLAIV